MKLLREPLFQFVVLGAALFTVYAIGGDFFASDPSRLIEITASDIELLAGSFERQWRRPPTADEMKNLVENRVREEVMYREALAMGLDRNDVVVRRRMMQKMNLLSQDLAAMVDPTDAQLENYLREHENRYRIPPRLTFSHVYFNPDRRGTAAADDALRLLANLRARSKPPDTAAGLGDRFMPGYEFERVSPMDVSRQFGQRFADSLFSLDLGWQGPLASGYGLHLVNIVERYDGRVPAVGEVRADLARDYNRDRSDSVGEKLYESLRGRFEVRVDQAALRRYAE
jgi:hypothetical protein